MEITVYLLTILIFVVAGTKYPAMSATIPDQERGIWLVRAEVTDVKIDPNGAVSTLKISHIYNAQNYPQILGSSFKVFSQFRWGSMGINVSPIPVKGEQWIWAVENNQSISQPVVSRGNYGGIFPVRNSNVANNLGVYKSFQQGEIFADFIEKVSNKSNQEMPEILKENSFNENIDISSWSIKNLVHILPRKDAISFLRENVSKIEIRSGIVMESELNKIEGDSWANSNQRKIFIEKLTSVKNEELEKILDFIVDSENFELGKMYVLKSFFNRKKIDLKVFKKAIAVYLSAAGVNQRQDETLIALIDQMASRKLVDYRLIVVESIRSIKLSKQQVDVVQKLTILEKDSRIRHEVNLIVFQNS